MHSKLILGYAARGSTNKKFIKSVRRRWQVALTIHSNFISTFDVFLVDTQATESIRFRRHIYRFHFAISYADNALHHVIWI